MLDGKRFTNTLVSWYNWNKRDLPWRNTKSAYHIWLSEIILQQTRVTQGLPYYERFTNTFPTIHELANAPQQEVLKLWEGLGYYSRARNLHECAKTIVKEHNGQFPQTYEELLKLKGIGPYTAAAIASFAFRQKAAAVDGNVMRVLARIFGLEHDIATTQGRKAFFQLANQIIPAENPDTFNQAMMEFGALQCTPKSPNCSTCPYAGKCLALNNNQIKALPVKTKKVTVKKRYFTYMVFNSSTQILLKKREEKDIWQGLWDFHLIEEENNFNPEYPDLLPPIPKNTELIIASPSIIFEHQLTHQKIHARFININVREHVQLHKIAKELKLEIIDKARLEELPRPRLLLKYLETHPYPVDKL